MTPHRPRRHPFHDAPAGNKADPRGADTPDPTPETIDLMRRRLALEAQAAARGPQGLYRDALAREQEWAA